MTLIDVVCVTNFVFITLTIGGAAAGGAAAGGTAAGGAGSTGGFSFGAAPSQATSTASTFSFGGIIF